MRNLYFEGKSIDEFRRAGAGPHDCGCSCRNCPQPRDRREKLHRSAAARLQQEEEAVFETLELESARPVLRRGSSGSAVVDLQQRLAALDFNPGSADGIFGALTESAVLSFQRSRGLLADGIVGAQTWDALLGTSAPQAPPAPGSPGDPQVTIPSGVVISDNAVRVLKNILRAAGLSGATVTSGRRTSTDQARIMYELIERHGVSYAKNLYGSYGDQIIDRYVTEKAAGKSATGIKAAMESKIKQLGCQKVSHHCSDSYDVFDVAPSSITDSAAFRRALDDAVLRDTIEMYLSPPDDPAFHIEIALAPTSRELPEFETLEWESEFRLSSLPGPVREAFNLGPLGWPLAVMRSIDAGRTNLDDLADMVFFMHHPERLKAGVGGALSQSDPDFAKLANEWKGWQTLIKPILQKQAPPRPKVSPGVTPSPTSPLRYGVANGKIFSAFDKWRNSKNYAGYHLGIDVSTYAGNIKGADDPRRGLPVYFTPKLTISKDTLDTARVSQERKGPITLGLGVSSRGDAVLEEAVVIQTTSNTNTFDSGYGSSVGIACVYTYPKTDGSTGRFTLYVSYRHLITEKTLPVVPPGRLLSLAEWQASGKQNRMGFGPRMVRKVAFTREDLPSASGPPLVGYLGATKWPHVHIDVAFSHGVAKKYLRSPGAAPRVDPAVVID